MTPTPRPRTGTQSPRETTGTRRRGRPARLLLVVLGVVLSMVATATPASAQVEWSQTTSVDGGPGYGEDTFVINNATVDVTAKYIVGGNQIRGVQCSYRVSVKTDTSQGRVNGGNNTVKKTVDYQATNVTNQLLPLNIYDRDQNVGGRASFQSDAQILTFMGETSLSRCKDDVNVTTQPQTPSYWRKAAGGIAGAAVAVAVYGAAAAATVAAGGAYFLGFPAWEAAMGCLAGVAGRLVYDIIVIGKTDSFASYLTLCALGAASTSSMTVLGKYFKNNPAWLSKAVMRMGRYSLNSSQGEEAGIEMVNLVAHLARRS